MASSSDDIATTYGFNRPEMYTLPIPNSVSHYCERIVFLCYKEPDAWPSIVEDSLDDRLPNLLSSALKARKDDLPFNTRLTVFGGGNRTDFTDGDVLIFPDMVKYRGLKETDVDTFVDDVLVRSKPWAAGIPESLVGAYVFVCAHANRDKRCGFCGPVLIEKFKEEIESRSFNDKVFVFPSSHLGGHKYAGNIVIFAANSEGKINGDWYGYVTPNDVADMIDVHIGKGEIITKLWRGQMGLKVETSEKAVENKSSNENARQKTEEKCQISGSEVKENITGCCQGANGVSCCRDVSEIDREVEEVTKKTTLEKPRWIGKWEQSDAFVAAGVVGAVATVVVAYSVLRRST